MQYAIVDVQKGRFGLANTKVELGKSIVVRWRESDEVETVVVDQKRFFCEIFMSPGFWYRADPEANRSYSRNHPFEFFSEVLQFHEDSRKKTPKGITVAQLTHAARRAIDPKITSGPLGNPAAVLAQLKQTFGIEVVDGDPPKKEERLLYVAASAPASKRPASIKVVSKEVQPQDLTEAQIAAAFLSLEADGVRLPQGSISSDIESTAQVVKLIVEKKQNWSLTSAFAAAEKLGSDSAWGQLVLLLSYGDRDELKSLRKSWATKKKNSDTLLAQMNAGIYDFLPSEREITNLANLFVLCVQYGGRAFISKLTARGFEGASTAFVDHASISDTALLSQLKTAFVDRVNPDIPDGRISITQSSVIRMLKSADRTKSQFARQVLNATAEKYWTQLEPEVWLTGLSWAEIGLFQPTDAFARLIQTDHFEAQVVEMVAKPFIRDQWDTAKLATLFSAKKWLQALIYEGIPSEQFADALYRSSSSDDLTRAIFSEIIPSRSLRDLTASLAVTREQIAELENRLLKLSARLEEAELGKAKLERERAELSEQNQMKFDAAVEYKAGYWFRALEDLLSLLTQKFGYLPSEEFLSLALQVLSSAGFNSIGTRGDVVNFDERVHERIEGRNLDSELVEILTPGITFKDVESGERLLRKAIVKVAF